MFLGKLWHLILFMEGFLCLILEGGLLKVDFLENNPSFKIA